MFHSWQGLRRPSSPGRFLPLPSTVDGGGSEVPALDPPGRSALRWLDSQPGDPHGPPSPGNPQLTEAVTMDEHALRELVDRVRAGAITRRQFTRMMVGVGLTAPMVAQVLASAGLAQAQPKTTFTRTRRGGGGLLKVLWWQAPTLLNPHFANGTKDQDGSRVFYGPLAATTMPTGTGRPSAVAEPRRMPGRPRAAGVSATARDNCATGHPGAACGTE